ncbi:hypothetical protein GWK41_07135 [Persephonella atlantica]|uniref:TonB-dependent receptor plug domain-containing protein n=1 Tax=Persephonella atlantica TaxID=2699429 RepID=A0ABS1GIR8_9AQUI|nr:TonB-dependent receptor plug domain-containing protein [Persephonella atlantica]MBK3332839.1 hypothetical protein [Persephonella atlantica]
MERKVWLLILQLSFFLYASGETLENLLSKYTDLTKLYKKTRQESEGHIILITREDIERLQAHRLSDILRSIRYFFLQRNHYGEEILSYATIYPLENSTVRLFINDHEISAVFRKTPLPLWADVPLDFVEHIEIYQGESAVKFNNEVAGTIIKVYTKLPERENSGLLRGSVSTKKGYSADVYLGKETGESSAFSLFFGREDYRTGEYKYGVSDRQKNYYAYTQFKIKKWNFESGLVVKSSGRFRGDTISQKPDYSDFNASHGYISLSKIISEELSLKLRIYGDKISSDSYQKGTGIIAVNPVQITSYWDRYVDSYKFGTDITGSKEFSKHQISFGGKLQRTGYRLKDSRDTGRITDKNNEIYSSLFLEDVFNITPFVGIIGGIKYEKINRDYGSDFNLLLWRAGIIYIHSSKSYAKLFVSKYYTPPYFVEIYTNANLKKQKNQAFTFEMSGESSLGRFIFTGGYIKVEDSIMINPSDFSYYNASDTLKYKFFSVDYRKSLGGFIFDAGYFHVKVNDKKYKTAPSTGWVLRGSYKLDEFSGFLEFIYRGSYRFSSQKIKEGYELNGGFRIKVMKDSYLELKGYNILNTAQKIPAFKDPDFKYYLEDRRFVLTFVKEF